MALRVRARKSELLPLIERLSKRDDLEIKSGVVNPELPSHDGSHDGKTGSSFKDKLIRGAVGVGSAYLGYKAARSLMKVKETAMNNASIYNGVPTPKPVVANNSVSSVEEPSYTGNLLKSYNSRHDEVAPDTDTIKNQEKIANKMMSLLKKHLSSKTAMFGPYSAFISELVQKVASDFNCTNIDVIRHFTAVHGHEPVMYFEINMGRDTAPETNFEFATLDDVEGDLHAFDDACDSITEDIDGDLTLEALERNYALIENASAGATASGNVATVVGGLGAGDPSASIYHQPNKEKPKKKKKRVVLRRR